MSETTTITTTDSDAHIALTATVDAYLEMLNEPDAGRRADLIERAWSEDGGYVDPMLQASGHDGLNEMVAGVQAQFPGHRFVRTTGIDAHHSLVRFGWEMRDPSGGITVSGLDVGIVADDGRLSRIAAFFGPLPSKDAA